MNNDLLVQIKVGHLKMFTPPSLPVQTIGELQERYLKSFLFGNEK